MKKQMNWVKICPNCGSANIGVRSGVETLPYDFCKDCGFNKDKYLPTYFNRPTIFFPNFPKIKSLDIEKFRKQIKKKKIA